MEINNVDNQQLHELGPFIEGESAPSITKPGPSNKDQLLPPNDKPLPDLYYDVDTKCYLVWKFICLFLLILYIGADIAMQIIWKYINGFSIFDDVMLSIVVLIILFNYCTKRQLKGPAGPCTIQYFPYILASFPGFITKTMGVLYIKYGHCKSNVKFNLVLVHALLLLARAYFMIVFIY